MSTNKKIESNENELFLNYEIFQENPEFNESFEKYLIFTNNLNQSQKDFNEIFSLMNIMKPNEKSKDLNKSIYYHIFSKYLNFYNFSKKTLLIRNLIHSLTL